MKYQRTKIESLTRNITFLFFLFTLLSYSIGQTQMHEFIYKTGGYNYDKQAGESLPIFATFEGEIILSKTEDANDVYLISVKEIKVEGDASQPLMDIPVFDIKFIPVRQTNTIILGFVKNGSPDNMIRGQQLLSAFKIFEMAMLDVISEEYVFPDNIKHDDAKELQLKTEVYQYYDCGKGKQDIRKSLTGGTKVTVYRVMPMIRENILQEVILTDIQINRLSLKYQMREKDHQSGAVTHAINLDCAFKKDLSDEDISSILKDLGTPAKFNNYYYSELIIKEN